MTFIIVLAIIMFNSTPDALVDNDYYEKGINYNQDYDRKEQVSTDHAKPDIALEKESIVLTFQAPSSGKVRLVRTADKRLDRLFPFETNAQQQVVIPSTGLQKGSWRVIIEWKSNDKSYLYEQEVQR